MEYILGVFVSIVVEIFKKTYKTSRIGTYVALLVFSLVSATVYHFALQSVYWETIVQVLTAAGAFHNLVIRQLNSQE